ncbi:MAG: sugar phosphate nucleotidyltransferase [Ignavibacteriae bacterium]|nr:sugar phosphate nucleotidyltransferase [Ignavibacteriota bacterium]
MKAMILAAGFGTRLKPLTDNLPKALVPFGNEPMIIYQIKKLKEFGFTEIVINAHHFADKITDYFNKNSFGIKIDVIEEEKILGTGGGILNAKKYFENEDFFLVINVDVFTDFDFSKIIIFHKSRTPLASVAVQKRKTKRYLEFDSDMRLIRRQNENSQKENLYAFNGIHIISNKIFQDRKIEYLDIFDLYLEMLNNKDEEVFGFDVEDSEFRDLGKRENLDKIKLKNNIFYKLEIGNTKR